MSQLPEVEVVRKELEKEVAGKRVKDVDVSYAQLVRRHRNRPDFVKKLVGHKIEAVTRRGVHLTFELDEDKVLVIRMGDQGMLSRETATEEAGKATQFVAVFTTGGALHYVDAEKGGEMWVMSREDAESSEVLNPGGIDPLAATFTWRAFADELARLGGPLKTRFMDESFIVGLGDRYSDEVLWAAGLSPERDASTLSSQEGRRLYRAMLEVLNEAVKQRTNQGVPAGIDDDEDAENSDFLKVFSQEGRTCARCRREVVYRKVADGYHAYFCSACQT